LEIIGEWMFLPFLGANMFGFIFLIITLLAFLVHRNGGSHSDVLYGTGFVFMILFGFTTLLYWLMFFVG
jgi:hypothetical protein